ncbi:hypothetical protein MT325_m703L [Paramecium bursaria chlorella virus MT325]|uniref:Uncharacterized protein m703L n=1 Tax=Paramecium bursaria Chlorella virus MT325 TaxID=346932 RepID=A7IV83_PBCVM|nr:hypothetical protein MT325_m703L [Paramecium bursaria chlorella virus MT325]
MEACRNNILWEMVKGMAWEMVKGMVLEMVWVWETALEMVLEMVWVWETALEMARELVLEMVRGLACFCLLCSHQRSSKTPPGLPLRLRTHVDLLCHLGEGKNCPLPTTTTGRTRGIHSFGGAGIASHRYRWGGLQDPNIF